MSNALTRQARQLYQVFSALVRAYQFRDRDDICCHGVSVSQCYALDVLAERGPRTMSELASDLYLEISSMTRAVDELVTGGLAERAEDARDRRVRRVRITSRGRNLLKKIQDDLVREHERVLEQIDPEARLAAIQTMAALLEAFQERQRRRSAEVQSACCASPTEVAGRPRRRIVERSAGAKVPRDAKIRSQRGRERA